MAAEFDSSGQSCIVEAAVRGIHLLAPPPDNLGVLS